MKYNAAGRPILSDPEIEEKSYEVLAHYKPECLQRPNRTPIADILTNLKEEYDVAVEPAVLGEIGGFRIRGAIVFRPKLKISIAMDIFLEAGSRFLFTAAHEIGHLVLHRHRDMKLEDVREYVQRISDTDAQFDFPRQLTTEREWVEHQANHFAACLLMPTKPFSMAVVEKQQEMGIVRDLGRIWVDETEAWRERDFKPVVAHLQKVFGTSKTAIGYRLNKLGLVVKPNQPDVTDFIADAMRQIEGLYDR